MLLEPADFGFVYDDETKSASNKVILNDMIEGIKNGSLHGGGIRITGPTQTISGNVIGRVAGVAHVDVNPASKHAEFEARPDARGPIKFPTDDNDNVVPFRIEGLPGTVLRGRGVQETAGIFGHVVEIDNSTGQASHDPENSNMQIIECLNIQSASRGIWIKRAGRQCILQRVHVHVSGLLSDTPGGTTDNTWTEWHDWDEFRTRLDTDSVPYGIRIDNCDGTQLLGVNVKDCKTHGILITRLNDGYLDIRSSENKGVGLAGTQVNGCRIIMRGESNGSYAILLQDSRGNDMRLWTENNRRWNNNAMHSFVGSKHRPICLGSRCQSNEIWTKSENRNNLVRMSEATRRSNRFRDLDWIEPSLPPVATKTDLNPADFNTGTPASHHNYHKIWALLDGEEPNPFRPTFEIVGTGTGNQIELTIPKDAYASGNLSKPQSSFLYVFASHQNSLPKVSEGDMVLWSCVAEFDDAAIDFCIDAENNRGAALTLAMPTFLKMHHGNDPKPEVNKDVEQAHANIHMWNKPSPSASFPEARRRKFSGRKFIYPGSSTAFPRLLIGTWTGGLIDSGPASSLKITFHDFLMWHVPRGHA